MKMDRKAKTGAAAEKLQVTGKSRRVTSKSASMPNGKHPLASYEHIPIGIVESSPDGKHLNVNEEFCRITGYQRQELLQLGIRELTYEEDYTFDINLHEQLVAGKVPFYKIEKRIKRKDGGLVWVELTRSLVRDEEGEALYTVGAVLDISDRKHVERVLRESVERQRLATEAARMFTWEWNFETQIYTLADSFVQVLGFSGDLLPQNKIDQVLGLSPAEDVQRIRQAVDRAIESRTDLRSLQFRMVNPENGETVWLEMNGKVVYNEQGRAVRMFGVAQNITQSKLAEEKERRFAANMLAAAEANAKFRTFFDQGSYFAGVMTPDGTIVEANRLSLEFCGFKREDIVGKKFWDCGWWNPSPALVEMIRRGTQEAAQGKLFRQESNYFLADGSERFVDLIIAPVKDESGQLLFLAPTGTDITERKRVEQALTEFARQQEALYKLADQLHRTESVEDIFNAALDAILSALHCDRASILLFDDRDVMAFAAWRGLSDEYRQATTGHSPWQRGVTDAAPICIDDIRTADLDESLKTVIEEEGIGSLAFIPLVLNGNLIGKFMVYFNTPHVFGASELDLSLTIAHQLAFGIDRRRAEEALRESEQRYRFIVENTSDGIWWIELTEPMPISLPEDEQIEWYYNHAVIRQCNLGLARMYGYNAVEDVIGMPLRTVMPPENPLNLELTRKFIRSGYRLVDSESREIGDGGRELVFLNNMIGVIEEGKLKGEWGTNRDITERKRAEEDLRASEELYRTIARSIPGGGVYVVDKDFRYLIAEGPVTVAFGLSREILEGRTVSEVFPDERGARMEERLRRTFAGETVGFETNHNGRVYWTQQAPLLDSVGRVIIVTIDITERKQAEDALRQSEERFVRFMQHLPGLAWIKDQDGRYVYANAAAERAFHTPGGQLYGKTDEDVFPAEIAAQFRRNDELVLADEKGVQVIETLEQEDGILHYSLVNKFPIPGPDGNITLIGGTAFDITERKRAEEALQESEERFRAILNQATAGIVRKDTEGRLVFVNQAFCNMLGYTESELIGKTVWEFMHPEDVAVNKQSYERLMDEGIPFKLERRFLRKDGSVIWVDASVSPIMDADGKLQSAVAVEVDITRRKLAQKALRDSEKRYRNLFDLIPVAVYSCDAQGLIQEYNHRAVALWGREPARNDPNEKYCGSFRIYYPDGRFMPHEACPMARSLSGERLEPHEFEILVEREDGSRRNVLAHPLLLRNEQGEITGAINCLYDITERKQAEEALRELNLQLESRVHQRTARLNDAIQTLRDEIAERRKVEEALRKSEAVARENEEKLSTLFDLLPVGISFLDREGHILQMNSALANILKLSKEQLLNQEYTSRKYIKANGTRMLPAEFASQRALTEGKTVYNIETGTVLENGDVVWTSVSAAPVAVGNVDAVVVTVDVTESKRAERALQESRERLQVLSQRLVEVQEEERRAIARELHDRVGQTLAALNINLIIISGQLAEKVDEQVRARLSDSMNLVAETITLVRDVMSNLRPSVLDDYGLEAALQSYVSDYMTRYEIKVVMEKSEPSLPRLGPSIEMTFLRIAQEALMNIARHARASQVVLALQREENNVCMTIQDNGKGIQSWQEANRPGSHGLTIMRERAEALGGTFKVVSAPEQGTRVEVNIPFKEGNLTETRKELLS